MASFLWPSSTAQPPQRLFLLLMLPHLMTLAKLQAALFNLLQDTLCAKVKERE